MAHYESGEIPVGQYTRARICVDEYSQNIVGNYSNIAVYVIMWRTNSGYTTEGAGTLHIGVDGKGWFESAITRDQKLTYNSNTIIGAASYFTDEGKPYTNTPMYHDGNGNLTFNVYAWTETSNSNMNFGSNTFTVTLTKIDRDPCVITSRKITNVGTNSITFKMETNIGCDCWQYSLFDTITQQWSGYQTFSSAWGTSAEYTINNLKVNTDYIISCRTIRSYNGCDNIASNLFPKTLGNSEISHVNDLIIDVDSPVLSFGAHVYVPTFTTKTFLITEPKEGAGPHIIELTSNYSIKDGENTILLTSDQRTILLQDSKNASSITAVLCLRTYSGSTQIGNDNTWRFNLNTSELSDPVLSTELECQDANNITLAITGNKHLYIQGKSSMVCSGSVATAKNYASIAKYVVDINGNTKEEYVVSGTATTFSITFGSIDVSGDVQVRIAAYDTRGRYRSTLRTLTVLPYSNVDITDSECLVVRTNTIESGLNTDITGKYSPIMVNEVNKNPFTGFKYRAYRTDEDTTAHVPSDWTNLRPTGVGYNDDGYFELLNTDLKLQSMYYVAQSVSDFTNQPTYDGILADVFDLTGATFYGINIINNDLGTFQLINPTSNSVYAGTFTLAKMDTGNYKELTSNSQVEFASDGAMRLANVGNIIIENGLNPDYSYYVDFMAYDKLSNDTIQFVVRQGIPLLSYRKKKVGINNPNPSCALDVNGDIAMNGFGIMGYLGELSATTNLNDVTESGIYLQDLTVQATQELNYPKYIAGILEVINNSRDYVIQRYTSYVGDAIYVRARYHGSWYGWRYTYLSVCDYS